MAKHTIGVLDGSSSSDDGRVRPGWTALLDGSQIDPDGNIHHPDGTITSQ